jgi:hypothetical protein
MLYLGGNMTLEQWVTLTGVQVTTTSSGICILVNKHTSMYSDLWHLTDYLVIGVACGVVWLTSRTKRIL